MSFRSPNSNPVSTVETVCLWHPATLIWDVLTVQCKWPCGEGVKWHSEAPAQGGHTLISCQGPLGCTPGRLWWPVTHCCYNASQVTSSFESHRSEPISRSTGTTFHIRCFRCSPWFLVQQDKKLRGEGPADGLAVLCCVQEISGHILLECVTSWSTNEEEDFWTVAKTPGVCFEIISSTTDHWVKFHWLTAIKPSSAWNLWFHHFWPSGYFVCIYVPNKERIYYHIRKKN